MKKAFLILTLGFLLLGCSNNDVVEEKVIEEEIIETIPVEDTPEVLEIAPVDFLNSIATKTTGIEATMYQSAASFMLYDQPSILSFFQMVLAETPVNISTNKIGHIMFLENGNSLLLAYVYSSGDDIYMKTEKDGESYYNLLNGKAKEMFTNIQVNTSN